MNHKTKYLLIAATLAQLCTMICIRYITSYDNVSTSIWTAIFILITITIYVLYQVPREFKIQTDTILDTNREEKKYNNIESFDIVQFFSRITLLLAVVLIVFHLAIISNYLTKEGLLQKGLLSNVYFFSYFFGPGFYIVSIIVTIVSQVKIYFNKKKITTT